MFPLHEKYTTAHFIFFSPCFSVDGRGVAALFVVEVSFAEASFEQPSPNTAAPAAAPMHLANSLLVIVVFLSCGVYFVSRKVRKVRKVVISEIVHNTLDSVFQRWHAKVDYISKPLVQ